MTSLAPRLRRPALATLLLLALVAIGLPVSAQEDAPVQRTPAEIDALALDMQVKYMSPYCPGANLRDCTSSKAADLRAEIRQWIAEGRTERWIEDTLVARHGESILGAPRFKGFNMLVWIFPIIAVVVGLGLIFAYLQRQHSMALDKSVPSPSVPEDYRADPALESRLEKELASRGR